MLNMEILENQNILAAKILTKEEFDKQGLELVNIKFIDDETSIYITRKKKKKD